MLIKTLLNKVEKYSSFVYKKIYLGVRDFKKCLIIEIHHRLGSKGKCPVCLKRCSTYDTASKQRLFSARADLGISRVFFISSKAYTLQGTWCFNRIFTLVYWERTHYHYLQNISGQLGKAIKLDRSRRSFQDKLGYHICQREMGGRIWIGKLHIRQNIFTKHR